MIAYIIRRMLYAVPILIGVNLLTFLLFFVVNSPDEVARLHLGDKHVTEEQVEAWKHERGYDLPLAYNAQEEGLEQATRTIFFTKSVRLFAFDFGNSDSGRNIGYDIRQRMWPSLAIAVPSAVNPLERNVVISPAHHDFHGVVPGAIRPFVFDRRLAVE